MPLTKLYYFKLVAHYENFTKAAKELNISQPALSKSMHLLEQELNTTLFRRLGNTIELNENGQHFLIYCEQILQLWETAKREVSLIESVSSIFISLKVATSYLPALLDQINSLNLPTHITITQQPNQQQPDIILSSQKLAPHLYDALMILEEDIHLAIPPTLLSKIPIESPVTVLTLESLPMILLTHNFELRQTINSFYTQQNLTPKISYEVDHPSLVRNILDQELGIALIPVKTWKLSNKQIKLFPTDKLFKRHLYLLTLKSHDQNKQIHLVSKLIINFFKQVNESS